ncbi:hypothetical protein K456DRAFT_163505 [Colletotrichum gloeosporioides 23]|nr:hypothetical protein K456DRAFT_163505 [Colletotrichum gloeosporioides 23]
MGDQVSVPYPGEERTWPLSYSICRTLFVPCLLQQAPPTQRCNLQPATCNLRAAPCPTCSASTACCICIWNGIWKREACRTEVHALASTHTRPAFSQDPAAAAASTYHLHGGDGITRPHFCICHDLLSAVSAHQCRQSLNDTIVCPQTRTELLATPTSPPAPGTWTRALAVKLESAYGKPSLQRNATQPRDAVMSPSGHRLSGSAKLQTT